MVNRCLKPVLILFALAGAAHAGSYWDVNSTSGTARVPFTFTSTATMNLIGILNTLGTATASITGYNSADLRMTGSGWSTQSTAAVTVWATQHMEGAASRADGVLNHSWFLLDYQNSQNVGALAGDTTKVLQYDFANRELTLIGQDTGSSAMFNLRARPEGGSDWIRYYKNDNVDTSTVDYTHTWQTGVNGWTNTYKYTIIRDVIFDSLVISEDGKWMVGRLPTNLWQQNDKSLFTSRFMVKGYVDENQFVVQGSTGQSAAIFQIQKNDATVLTSISASGDLNFEGHTVSGSEASGGSLFLRSTSNATKGTIVLGSAATTAYDEVNDRIGIGTGSPSEKLDVRGTGTTYALRVSTSSTGSPVALGVTNAGNVSMTGSLAITSLSTAKAAVIDANGFLNTVSVSTTELSYVAGVTSAIQTQLNGKQATITTLPIANGGTNSGTALSGSSIMVSNGSAIVQGSAGTSTQVLHGNASGTPTYSQVSLTADVTGSLPVANGGLAANQLTAAQIASGSSILNQIGGTWISSVTHNATGDSTLNLTASFFSAAPYCTCTAVNDSTPNGRVCKTRSTSSSAIRVVTTVDSTDAAADENYTIMCFGAR